jgi:hypothetical protein
MTTHPYLVLVQDATGKREHRFRALHIAETFMGNLRADADMSGHTISLTLYIGDKVVQRC